MKEIRTGNPGGWGGARKRILLALGSIALGAVIALLIVRPWSSPEHDCFVIVRPGESIQAAIDAAAPGDVICLARGRWSESLVIDKSVTLAGRGVGRTVIEPARYRPGVEITGLSDTVNVKLVGLTISREPGHTGVLVNGGAIAEIKECSISVMQYGIRVVDSAHLILEDSTVSDSNQRGVVLLDSARASISRSRITANLGAGLWLLHSAEATIVDSEVSGNFGNGLWLRDESRVMIGDCSVSGNSGSGLRLTGQSQAEILRTKMSGNGSRGIEAEGSAKVNLTESELLSSWHGIELEGEARAAVTRSTISDNRWDGISVQSSASLTISESDVLDNMRGIGLGGSASAEISDCLIVQNSQYGVFSWSAGDVTGEGNALRENGIDLGGNLPGRLRLPLTEAVETIINWPDERYPSLQEAVDALLPGGRLVLEQGTYTAGLTIGGEVSLEAGHDEVVLTGKSSALPVFSLVDGADLRIKGATISGGSTGLTVSAGARMALIDCIVADNSQGINMSRSASAELVDSVITDNLQGGIFLGGVAQATILGCSISGNVDYGISVADAGFITVKESTLADNGVDAAIMLSDSCRAILEANTITGSRGYGLAIRWHQCFPGIGWFFSGQVSGKDNTFADNRRGDVCPPALGFLATPEGGELDYRPSPSL